MADGDTPNASEKDAEDEEWLPKKWYRTRLGRALIVFDVLLTVVLVVGTTVFYAELLEESLDVLNGGVPGYIYVFALLGALGYIFTTLAEDFHRTTGDVIQYNFRLPAALPLGVGILLLADVILADATASPALMAGIVFLAGLYVNLAYLRMGALAKRLLPGATTDQDEEVSSDGNGEGQEDDQNER